jgi:hypothetical protein
VLTSDLSDNGDAMPRALARFGRRTAAGLAGLLALAAVAPAGAHPARAAAAGPSATVLRGGVFKGGAFNGGAFKGGAFNGASAVRASSAWAVGTIETQPSTLLTLAARWNGTSWSRVPSPSPGGSNAASELTGVSSTSSSDAWAVGSYGTFGPQTLALHWNGASWTQVSTPNPGYPSASDTLAAVSAVSATDAWAVGSYGNADFSEQTMVLNWDGTAWTLISSPSPGGTGGLGHGTELLGVSATSRSSAWAVGCYDFTAASGTAHKTLALQWNGTVWAQVPTPTPGVRGCLTSVTALSPSSAWAVGWTEASLSAPDHTLVLHWNGTAWKQVASPSATAASSQLNAVSAISATDAWAVGYAAAGKQPDTTLILHWNGTDWATVASPNAGSSELNGVSGGPAGDLLAVGTSGTGTLALHWNGSRWVTS